MSERSSKKPSSSDRPESDELRNKLIGLGERSIKKSYYPALRKEREDLERFRSIMDRISDVLFLFTPEGILVDVNETACSLLGQDRDSLIGSSFFDLFPGLDLHQFVINDESGAYSLCLTEVETTLAPIPGFHDRERILELRFSSSSRGAEQYMVAVGRDVTGRIQSAADLERSERKYRTLYEAMQDGFAVLDLDGRIVEWNQAFQKIIGYPSTEVPTLTNSDITPERWQDMEARILAEQVEQRGFSDVYEKEYLRRDGSLVPVTMRTYRLFDEHGVPSGYWVFARDITDLKRAQEMVIQSEKMMSIGGLAAGMAHEINNPLAAIIGYSYNILKRTFGDLKKNRQAAEQCGVSLEDVRAYLEAREIHSMLEGIHESGKRASSIVGNMLQFSRKSTHTFQAHDLSTILDYALDIASTDYDLSKKYDFRRIVIARHYDSDTPPAWCERTQLQQVFLNIFKNGAEALADKTFEDDAPRFIVRVRAGEGNRTVVAEIEDNGPGLDAETRKHIFEPFFTTKPVGKGTGLGLSVSYFIVADQHRGNLEVFSSPGEWTRFVITLPTPPDGQETET